MLTPRDITELSHPSTRSNMHIMTRVTESVTKLGSLDTDYFRKYKSERFLIRSRLPCMNGMLSFSWKTHYVMTSLPSDARKGEHYWTFLR